MTNEEAQPWLTIEEQGLSSFADPYDQGKIDAVLRSLAETRKALAAVETVACEHCCDLCSEYNQPIRHKPTCIFATMPRPR